MQRLERLPGNRDLRAPLRHLALAAMSENRVAEKVDYLTAFLRRQFDCQRSSSQFSRQQMHTAFFAADLLTFLQDHCLAYPRTLPEADLAEWLFQSPQRFDLLMGTLSPHDNWAEVCRVLDKLYRHDPAGRDDYFDLILALAVVWDQPRPMLHGQIGRNNRLQFEADISQRYDYFNDLFKRGRSRVPYQNLSVDELLFVVDTPVPLSELVWARHNVRGNATSWGNKFNEIEYDFGRLNRGDYIWQTGAYSLRAIQENGGICVDQAYYAVMTARASGIPAMLFSGMGRRGAHAWMGHLVGRGRWEMDVGRYEYDEYIIGYTINPQKNQIMSDHDIDLAYSSTYRTGSREQAFRYSRLARQLKNLELPRFAEIFAERAIREVAIITEAWEVLEKLAARDQDDRRLFALLERKAQSFNRYPDALFDIRFQQSKIMVNQQKYAEAESLMAQMAPRVGRRREDLGLKILKRRVELLISDNRQTGARQLIESFLNQNRESGARLLPVAEYYIETCTTIGQLQAAASFMSRYIARNHSRPDNIQVRLIEMTVRLCELANDQRAAERARRRLQRYR